MRRIKFAEAIFNNCAAFGYSILHEKIDAATKTSVTQSQREDSLGDAFRLHLDSGTSNLCIETARQTAELENHRRALWLGLSISLWEKYRLTLEKHSVLVQCKLFGLCLTTQQFRTILL